MSLLTFVIADLHGRLDLLEQALVAVQRASPSGGTLVVLQGNHEDIMLQALEQPLRALNW